MQRHWEGAFVVRDEMDKRFKELSSVAMLARRDIDRLEWLSERRPDLAASAPAPPGVNKHIAETNILRKKEKKKKSAADGAKASSRRPYSCRGIDDMARSSGSELSDLLKFFSTLDMDLQKLLLEAITKHKSMKTTKKKGHAVVQKEGRKCDDQEICSQPIDHHQPRQLRHRTLSEDKSPCSFREWTQFSSKSVRENEKFSTEESSSSRAPWPSHSSCRLTNSSSRPRGGCAKLDAQDGVCRDVAIQTQRILPKASKFNHKARNQSWEFGKSFGAAGRLLTDHSAQTSSRGEPTRADDSEPDDIEKQREETTINVLERWAEPLEQYLTTLQKFEQQLREKWLNPEEIETTSNSGAQTGDLESLTYETSETERQRRSSDEVETQPGKPSSNRKLVASRPELTHDGGHPVLDNSNEESFVTHESGFKNPELRDPYEHFYRARLAANSWASQPGKPSSNRKLVASRPELTHDGGHPVLDSSNQENFATSESGFTNPELRDPYEQHFHRARVAASGSLHGKAKPEYLAAGFRTRKLVEWWPTDKPLHTTKAATNELSMFSVYDPKTLLGNKVKREQIPAGKLKKPEWWPALRRPYSASDIELMRKEDTAKAKRRKSPSKIFSGYHARRPPTQSSNKSQRRKTQEMDTRGNQCMAQQDDDSLKRAVQISIPPLSLPPRKSHQKAKEHGQKREGSQKLHKHCQNLSTVGDLERSNVKNYKAGHGGLHALQEHSKCGIQRISNTVEDQVCGMITQLEDQVCGIMTQLQEPEKESNLSLHQQIKTLGEADIQAGVTLPQANLQEDFQTPPVVDVHNEQREVEKKRNKRNQPNFRVQRGIERLADKLIDQAVNEVASELAEFCETVADQMYSAEFVT